MAAHDETIRLILEMKGQDSVAALNKTLEAQKLELKELEAEWRAGAVATNIYAQAQNQVQGEIRQTEEVIMQLKGTGAGGAGGRGVMAASYAFQDFTSQIQNGVGPALASIQNNIPGMLQGTGLSNPVIAAISAVSVAIGLIAPAIIKAFGKESQEEIDKAKEKVKEFEEQVKSAHEAFVKMTEKPTAPEAEYAENLKAILETRGTGDIVRTALAKEITGKEVEVALTPEQKKGRIGKVDMTDAEIEELARTRGVDPYGRKVLATAEQAAFTRERLFKQRDIEKQVRDDLADIMLKQAQVAGPAGDLPRERVQRAQLEDTARGRSIARELAGVRPEVMAAADAADRRDNEGLERATEAGVQRRKSRRNEREADAEAKRKDAEIKRVNAANDERVEREEQAGAEALDRIADTYRKRVDRDRIQDMRKQQQLDKGAARRNVQQQERELNQRDDDIVRGRAEIRENMIQSARDRGESHQDIAAMLVMSRQAAHADAAEREFWRRERAKVVESVMGGGQN